MILFLILFILGAQDKIDDYGVMFEDSSRSVLVAATHEFDDFSYTIPSTTVEIRGGDLDKAPFYQFRSSLKYLKFDNCNKLETLGPYCFSELIFAEIDMSSCTKLTYLSECCFRNCDNLISIVFPPKLEILGKGSLNSLDAITELNFPPTLVRIENVASPYIRTVGECKKLQNVTWGVNPSIQYIGGDAFSVDTSLRYIFIPASVQVISTAAFSLCPIQLIEIDDKNEYYSTDGTSLYDKQFTKLIFCPSTKSGIYTVNENVKTLSSNAFADSLFSEVVFPPNLESIGSQCFISSLVETLKIPSSVKEIYAGAFIGCRRLKNIEINASIKTICASTFASCVSINSLYIPRTVTEIQASAFSSCTGMDYIFFPRSVTKIATGAFAGINGSVILDFEEGSNHRFENSVLLSSDNKTFIAYIGDSSKELSITIRDSIETIGQKAFAGYKVRVVSFGEQSALRIIENEAFKGMPLTEISLPNTVEEIQKQAFESCSELRTVEFGSSLRLIGERGFAESGIRDIVLPDTTTSLGKEALAECKSVRSLSYNGLTVIGERCFAESSLDSITIKAQLLTIGKDSFSGSDLRSVIFEANVKDERIISDYAFRGAEKLVSVGFGLGTISVGEHSFEGCTSLESVRLSDSIARIGTKGFSGCSALREVAVGRESVLQEIGSFAFEKCPQFVRFEVPEENEHLCASAEEDVLFDKEMTTIILYLPATNRTIFMVPETVEQIGAYSFQGAEALEVVSVGGAPISFVGFGAFSGCQRLRQIDLPESIKTISAMAFEGCESLGCGSFIFASFEQRERLKEQLAKAEAPEESLSPCATYMFTNAIGRDQGSALLIASTITGKEEDGADDE